MSFFGSNRRTPPRSGEVVTNPLILPDLRNTPVMIAAGVNPIGMSYWRNINNHENKSFFYVVLSINDELTLFMISKSNLEVQKVQKLGINHTGEGIYFSATKRSKLFIPKPNSLDIFDVETGDWDVVWRVPEEVNLWQCHSSYDETMHSATIKDRNYNIIRWELSSGDEYEIKGEPDECQIDKSGKWLLIKENYGTEENPDESNRIIEISTGNERIIHNSDGALGHSDNGFECALGENDMASEAGALDSISFVDGSLGVLYSTGIWNMGYVSFTNAVPNKSFESQFCLVTTPSELIKVKLDGSGIGIKVCDNLTQDQSYENRAKANLCPLGEFAIWTAFVNDSLNAYIVRIPNA